MKKRYTLLMTALSACWLASGAVQVPYSSALGDKSAAAIASDWSIVDNNTDQTTWTYDSADDKLTAVTGANAGIKYGYNTKNNADDWAISPGFDLKGGTEYIISFWAKDPKASDTNTGNEAMNVYVGTSHFVDDLKTMTPAVAYNKNFGTGWTQKKLSYTPETDGTYYVAFQACSEKNQWGIYLRGFKIKSNVLTPGAPTALSATPSDDKSLSVSLSWTLPETDDEGNALATPLTSVTVRRNGETIATLPGDATEYTDTTLPEAGVYSYSVTVSLGEVESLPAECTTTWVGELTPQQLPYSEDFKDQAFVGAFWTCVDVDGDAKTNSNTSYPPLSYAWCFQSNPMKNAWWAVYYTPRNATSDENDWLISAPLDFPGPGKYKVSFKLCMYTGYSLGCKLGLYAGQDNTPEAMTLKIADVEHTWTNGQLNPNTDGTLFEYEFEVETGGTYYIGVHCNVKATTTERRLQLGAFKAELVELYESKVIMPPYSSTSDPDWQDTTSLSFSLSKGYYHAAWTCESTAAVSAPETALDSEFRPGMHVIRVTADCETTVSAEAPFTSFTIAPYDHTPAAAANCKYTKKDDGSMIFTWTCPAENTAGTALYEITEAAVVCDGETVATTTDCAPGKECELSVAAPAARDAAPAYTVVMRNLSGETSAEASLSGSPSGIEGVHTGTSATPARIFTISGTEVKAGTELQSGIYIEIRDGEARKIIIR